MGNAATVIFVVHAMGTTARLPAHFNLPRKLIPTPTPLPLCSPTKGEGVFEEEHVPQLVVKSVHIIVPVDPDQEPGCLHSQAMVRGLSQWFCSCLIIFPISPSILCDFIAVVPISSRVT